MIKFWFNCLMVTVFTFVLMGALYQLLQTNLFTAFDPIGQAIGDMELSDIAFSQIRDDNQPPDTNVVIVNIGYLSRGEIGKEISNILKFKPKVIGFDILLSCTDCPEALDTANNLPFTRAIMEAQASGVQVVMAHKLHQTTGLKGRLGDTEIQDSIEHTIPNLLLNSYEGFVNLETDAEHQEDLKACRSFSPKINIDGRDELAFAVRLAMCFDSLKAKKFLDRGKTSEIINYRGNVVDFHGAAAYSGQYPLLDPDQAMDTAQFDESMIRGKIVIFGFLGVNMFDTSWDDKFFTPINKKYAGKARPDMFGVVVHANEVSMILKEDYVDEMSIWEQISLAIIVLLLTSALFFKIEEKMPIWYDILSLVIQVALFAIFSLAMILAFSWYSVKLNFTLTLAAVALIGTCFELYNGGILRLYNVITSKFTKRTDGVSTHD
jgi:CHASE2 domain-containing sensor protein